MWKLVRIWILSSWSFLTIGILLGSWWAYHELGWGGWWFWDPVENASLMPWLLATACIHSITKPKLNYWTLISAQTTFILSILGTFFVRSGLLSSVHSFATDSTRAQALLFFLLSITSISVFNWISLCLKAVSEADLENSCNPRNRGSVLRARFASPVAPVDLTGYRASRVTDPFSPRTGVRNSAVSGEMKKSLEQILFLQNFYLFVICIVVFCGTSAPLIFHWFWNRDVGTGAPFYNGTIVPLFTSIFFVLVYAHYIQFNISNSTASRRSGPGPVSVFTYVASRGFTGISKTGLYFCIFFLINVLTLTAPVIGLNFLDSIYGAICILLISSIIAPVNQALLAARISKRAAYRTSEDGLSPIFADTTESTGLPGLPSRHIMLTPKLQFGIQWPRNQQKFQSEVSPASGHIRKIPADHPRSVSDNLNRVFGLLKGLYGRPTWGCLIFQTRGTSSRFSRFPLELESRKPIPKSVAVGPPFCQSPSRSRRSTPSPEPAPGALLAQKGAISSDREELLASQRRFALLCVSPSFRDSSFQITGSLPRKAREGAYRFWGNLQMRRQKVPESLLGRNKASVQMNVAHTGIVLFILGILFSNTFKLELTEQLDSGPLGIRLGSQVCCLRSIDHSFAPTYHSICANLLVYKQINMDGLYKLRSPFLLAPEPEYTKGPECRLSETEPQVRFGLGKTANSACVYEIANSTSNDYSAPIAPLVQLEGPFMASVCMFPEKRFYYSNQGAIATKVAIHSNLFTDFYSLIGTGSFETGWFTTIMKLPFIFCIWLGFMFGVFGGVLAVKKQLQKSKLFWL